MRTEALFFKTLFWVFVSFFMTSYMIFLVWTTESTYRALEPEIGFIEVARLIAVIPAAFSFFASIFFFPVLLPICFIQWWIIDRWLKNVITFVLMIVYGFWIFFGMLSAGIDNIFLAPLSKLPHHFFLSVPATLMFLIILSYFTRRFSSSYRLD